MANSRVPGPLGNDALEALVPARTPGPLGVNDAADPNVRAAPGDMPGPLGKSAELLLDRHSSDAPEAAAPESHWSGAIKGHLGDHPAAYHTLNNFGDTPLQYTLRIKNQGRCLLSLETQYEYKSTGLQRAWTAGSAQRGKTFEVTNGLPPHSSLHLRLFGERDYMDKDQSWCEGTVEAVLQK